ncbi:MAG: DUF1343 domain-containing protein [Planctomycetes bacterium]|nr:DUF1343 domain-containing protein [Planctomycetota bacterium]
MTMFAVLCLLLAPFQASPSRPPSVTLGIDRLLGDQIALVEGKRIGLITNPAGVDGALTPTVDRLARDKRVRLVRLFAPEHGIRGDVAAGDSVADAVDATTGIPVESLYGKSRRPSAAGLAAVDVLVFDLQDVGSRTYTFVSTLGECMRAAAEAKKPVIVLDRPNPLGGSRFDGPVIEKEFQSFIGWGAMPVTHGMTVGEVARFYRDALSIDCDLTVVALKGWKRSMTWEDTGLTWVPTSPHIPRALQAQLYVCTGMLGGILANVNDGVGSTQPFELVGASFVDGDAFAAELTKRRLPGLRVRACAWKPFYGKFAGQELRGVQLVLDDEHALEPVHTALELLTTLQALYGEKLDFEDDATVARHWGNRRFLELLKAGKSTREIEASFAAELATFAKVRERALIYRD